MCSHWLQVSDIQKLLWRHLAAFVVAASVAWVEEEYTHNRRHREMFASLLRGHFQETKGSRGHHPET